MTTTATKRNGKSLTRAVCKHSPGCEVVLSQQDLAAQMQTLGDTLGKALEVLDDRLNMIALSLNDVRERQTKADQREALYLSELGSVTRNMAQASVRAVRDELLPLVREEVKREVGNA